MKDKNKKKVLITGGAGFIGFNLVRYLLDQSMKVIAYDSGKAKSAELNMESLKSIDHTKNLKIIQDDVLNILNYKDLDFDIIIHLASILDQQKALDDPFEVYKINALGTQKAIQFARQKGNKPVIFTSSCKVYSNWLNELEIKEEEKKYSWKFKKAISEKDPLEKGQYARGIYGTSKRIAELMCQEYYNLWKLPVVIDRLSGIYGPNQYGSEAYGWVWHFVQSKIENNPINIYGTGKQVRDILFVADLCRLIEKQIISLLTNRVKFATYNVGGGVENTISLLEAIEVINQFGESELRTNFEEKRPADLKVYISNINKVKEEFDWSPKVDPEEGIKRLFCNFNKK